MHHLRKEGAREALSVPPTLFDGTILTTKFRLFLGAPPREKTSILFVVF